MKFPNAAKGVSKIFNAEIISLIAALIGGVGMVLSFIAVSGNVDQGTSDTLIIATGACALVAGIIIAVAGIMSIVGYFQAGKDEAGFKKAILCMFFSIAFTVAASFFANQTGFLGWLNTVLTVTGNVCNMLATIFLILGLMALSVKCSRPDMVKHGKDILTTLVILYILTFVLSFIGRWGAESTVFGSIVNWLSGLSLCFTIFLYIFQIYYLGKAKKMLKEN
ncbi:MAG: hypothetical protein IJT79_01430 [Ruminococcus sp.]|nr:hypothetical protein [Ruminococcus sp.]